MSQYLYLVRHGEHQDAEHGVPTARSRRGAAPGGAARGPARRLPFTAPGTTAPERDGDARPSSAAAARAGAAAVRLLFDCIPSGPTPDMPKAFESFFAAVTAAEIEAGRAQMEDAVSEFLTPA